MKQKKEFQKLLPQLEVKRDKKLEEQEATIYKGNKGIKSLLDDNFIISQFLRVFSRS